MTPTASYRTVQSGLTLTLVMLTTLSTGTGSTDRHQVLTTHYACSKVNLAEITGLLAAMYVGHSLYTGWAKKRGHRLMTMLLSNLNRFFKNSLEDSLVYLQLNEY